MEIIFILSREHKTLPESEVTACLEAEKTDFNIKFQDCGILILEINENDYNLINTIGKRFAYVHEVCKFLFKTSRKNLKEDVEKYPWEKLIKKDYAVRVKKIDPKSNINSVKMEQEIGDLIKSKLGENVNVNLENPATFIRTIVLDDSILITERIFKVPKKHFYELKPHKRPFFYPGSMSPKLARGMCNLSRVKKGSIVLDPFCGTGGILIEAGIIGAEVIGIDIDEKMVEGTIKNLEYCGIKDYDVFKGDARNIELQFKVDAVVTDPPYGISASTAGVQSKKIYEDTLFSMQKVIKKDGYICMATPHYLDIDTLISHTKFKIIEQYEIRMHKSLTRVISVLQPFKKG
ncbi:MAG: TIGR01177 family methyltransferase [Methanobacteriaceae archaeon]|jgi:tRNA (guanine10-N2)-dimethyltransferase